MKMVRSALLITLVFMLTWAWNASPTWLDYGLQKATRGSVGLTNAQGTLWKGQGIIQAITPAGRTENLAEIDWRIDPGSLLAGKIRIEMLSKRDAKPTLIATVTPTSLTIDQLKLELPAGLLGVASPTLQSVDLGGRIAITATGLRVDATRFSGMATLDWRQASSSLSPVTPLGNYNIALVAEPQTGVRLKIMSVGDSALKLEGEGQWQTGKPPQLNVTATPRANNSHQMTGLLRMIGKRISNEPEAYKLELDSNTGML